MVKKRILYKISTAMIRHILNWLMTITCLNGKLFRFLKTQVSFFPATHSISFWRNPRHFQVSVSAREAFYSRMYPENLRRRRQDYRPNTWTTTADHLIWKSSDSELPLDNGPPYLTSNAEPGHPMKEVHFRHLYLGFQSFTHNPNHRWQVYPKLCHLVHLFLHHAR